MSLELADRSIQYLRGIVENVVIKVDKFFLPIDFMILDMLEDSVVPIILGRSFLATARAMIDAFNKNITLRVGDDEVIFDMDQSFKRSPAEDDEFYEGDDFCECEATNESDSIRRMEAINTPYSVAQKIVEPNKGEREQLYSASANEIDEKKPELKILPQQLEYAYLHGDKYVPIIISSKLFEKERMFLLQVLEKIEVDRAKIDVIAKFPYPTNVKGLLMKDAKFDFFDDCKKAFNILKEKLTTVPIIISPDWNVPFELMCDAGDFTVGAMLGQRIDGKFKPIYYAHKILNNAQEHYTTTEKELIVVVFSFDKFLPNDGYFNGGNFLEAYIIGNSLHYQDYEWYEALKDRELKEEALRNKAIMEGIIDDDDESSYEGQK
ncbi:reverse transcriptase domain-containing protein [Tanacetum coccineum]